MNENNVFLQKDPFFSEILWRNEGAGGFLSAMMILIRLRCLPSVKNIEEMVIIKRKIGHGTKIIEEEEKREGEGGIKTSRSSALNGEKTFSKIEAITLV